jgi:DNA-binding transcriptional ArsR family regulator
MVYFQPGPLDRTFAALADPTRRALLARLSEQESSTVSELAKPFPISLPAVMKHLDVLAGAGLIARRKTGRTVSCRLRAEPMEDAARWLDRYRRFWSERLDRLAAFLEDEPWQQSTSSQASRSSAASRRRRRRSTAPGPTRKS